MSRAVRPQQYLNLDVEHYDTCQSEIPIALFTFCSKRPFVWLFTVYCEEGCCLLCCCLRLHSVCVVAYVVLTVLHRLLVQGSALPPLYVHVSWSAGLLDAMTIHFIIETRSLSSSLSSSPSSLSSTPASVSCHHHHHYDACMTFTKGTFPIASK